MKRTTPNDRFHKAQPIAGIDCASLAAIPVDATQVFMSDAIKIARLGDGDD
jgi:hypothetical protein